MKDWRKATGEVIFGVQIVSLIIAIYYLLAVAAWRTRNPKIDYDYQLHFGSAWCWETVGKDR